MNTKEGMPFSFSLCGKYHKTQQNKQQTTNHSDKQTLVKHKSRISTPEIEQKPNQTGQKDAQRVDHTLDDVAILKGYGRHIHLPNMASYTEPLFICVPRLGSLCSSRRSGASFQAARYNPRCNTRDCLRLAVNL